MKILFVLTSIFLFTQLQAEERWGDEHLIIPTKKNEKLPAFMVREADYKNKNYKLQAQLLCKYLKANPFIDLVNNKSSSWNANTHPKNPQSLYVEASKAADKEIESTCNAKEPFYGNLLMGVWGTFFSTCTVKNKECMDYASRYLERADLVSKSIFSSINFLATQKGTDLSGSKDCTGVISSESRSRKKDIVDSESSVAAPVATGAATK